VKGQLKLLSGHSLKGKLRLAGGEKGNIGPTVNEVVEGGNLNQQPMLRHITWEKTIRNGEGGSWDGETVGKPKNLC